MLSAASLREEGNANFKAARYAEAVEAYTRSLELDSSQHLCFSNRSAAHLKLQAAGGALQDAMQCVRLAPSWPKGYGRLASALLALGSWDEAEAACETGIEVAGDNLDSDLAFTFMRLLAEAERGREPRDPPPGAVPPQESR